MFGNLIDKYKKILFVKENRFSFTRKDFEWNNRLSPEIYTDIKGVILEDGEVILTDPKNWIETARRCGMQDEIEAIWEQQRRTVVMASENDRSVLPASGWLAHRFIRRYVVPSDRR